MDRTTARKLLSSHFETPVARVLARLGLSPNGITLLGLVVAGISAYLLSQGHLALGGAVLLASGVFDLLDGAVARYTGKVTTFGALLDSVVDRVSEAAVLLGLLVYYVDRSSTLEASLVYLALSGSTMVSYVRARAEGLGVECNVGIMQRPERVAFLGIGLVAGQWWTPAVSVALAVIFFLSTVTIVQRVLHVRQALARKDRSTPSAPRS